MRESPETGHPSGPTQHHQLDDNHSQNGNCNYQNGDNHRDGDIEAASPRKKGSWQKAVPGGLPISQRVQRITWAWFPATMSTGAMASLISQQPYTFTGLMTIGKIFYIVDIVMFCIFFGLILVRFAMKPAALTRSLHHPSESFFFGAFWVSVALLLYGMQVYGVPNTGPWLVSALRVLFWIYYASATLVAIFQYHVIFHTERLFVSDAMPAWILPAYPFLVTGVLAAAIAKTQSPESAKQMLLAGICGQGLGWILAFFIYTVFLTRLINSNMPPAPVRPGMYVSVGPAGYTCAGILALGKQAKTAIPPDFLSVDSVHVGETWSVLSVPVALFLWLIAIWFSGVCTLSIVRGWRKMRFSLQWWAFVFPNAGLAIATINVGEALSSRGIQITGSVITVLLVPLWLVCAYLHVRDVWIHELLAPGKDTGVEDVNLTQDEKARLKKSQKLEREREEESQSQSQLQGRDEEGSKQE